MPIIIYDVLFILLLYVFN